MLQLLVQRFAVRCVGIFLAASEGADEIDACLQPQGIQIERRTLRGLNPGLFSSDATLIRRGRIVIERAQREELARGRRRYALLTARERNVMARMVVSLLDRKIAARLEPARSTT